MNIERFNTLAIAIALACVTLCGLDFTDRMLRIDENQQDDIAALREDVDALRRENSDLRFELDRARVTRAGRAQFTHWNTTE